MRSQRSTTLGQLVEAVTRAAEDTADTGAQAKEMAERTLVETLVRAGRADLIDQLVELAADFDEPQADRRDRRDVEVGAFVAA